MNRSAPSRLTAVIRYPDGLYAILNSRREPFTGPKPQKDDDEGSGPAIAVGCPYDEQIVPLADVPASMMPGKDLLLRSWKALSTVEQLNAEVACSILHVLSGTIADLTTDSTAFSALIPDDPLPECRPTAAHPRAYRGTKHKPPKPPKPAPADLRPCLCSVSDLERLFTRLEPFFEEAIELVRREFSANESRESDDQSILHVMEQWWSSEYRKQIASLPAIFCRNLFWHLRACDRDTVATALSVYWALGLEQNEALMRCAVVLLSNKPGRQVLDWCRVISRMPPMRRVDFTELLIESGAYETPPDDETIAGLVQADALSGDTVYRHRMFYALRCVSGKCRLGYAIDGFLLANDHYEDHVFYEVGSLDGVAAAVRPFVEYVAWTEDWWRGSPLTLWKRCSELEGFRELFGCLEWQSLDPESAKRFFEIIGDVVYEELGEKDLLDKWRCIRQRADFMLRFVQMVDIKYRHKALEGLSDFLWFWDDPRRLDKALEPFCNLLKRLCSAPFRELEFAGYPLAMFTSLPVEEWSIIEKCGDAALIRLESETSRKNDAWLIGQGIWSLCEICPGLAATGFTRFPRQLLKAAHSLGVLDVPVRRETIRSFLGQPPASIDPSALSTEELVAMVEEYVGHGVADPVSRRLREHLKGERSLKPVQIERDVKMIHDGWLALQLDVLNRTAFDRLAVGMPTVQRTAAVQHALMIQQVADKNRRSLRRLLKSYLGGHREYSEQHPANRRWLEKHPKIDPAKWTQGITLRGEVAGHDILDLSVERDALEVLRLGSYFGTCLRVGGAFSYSAAAITLDINKQVVYARTSTGHVAARQLLAIAEDDSLVCFSVYPINSSKEILRLFRDFDLRMATFLGIDIFKEQTDEDDYEIAFTVSNRFWDDYNWDLEITEK